MVAKWSLEFATVVGDRTIERFDADIGRLSKYIGKTGSLDATIPIPNPNIGRRANAVFGGEGRLAMYAYRDNALWWGGFVDTTRISGGRSGSQLDVSGASFESYPDRRTARTKGALTNREQLDIGKFLWDEMQGDGLGASIGVETPQHSPSGRRRDFSWKPSDVRTYGSLLKEVSNRADGFEWIIDIWDDGFVRHRALNMGYPLIGRPTRPYVLTYPGQILEYEIEGDALDGANSFQARGKAPDPVGVAGTPGGGGTASIKQDPIMSAVYQDDGLLRSGHARIDAVIERDTVTQVSTLNDWAKLARDTRSGPLVLPEITCRLDGFDQSILGSELLIRISDLPFPPGPEGAPGYEGLARVIGYEIDPGEQGADDIGRLIFENPYDQDHMKKDPN
ncbi:hypothetical protein [Arthrobacter sp. 18067]|uniref:hypothetical protein n=1 Tax=Arthrobacter sp. 18067 TaxID=2681413 RepID=UPI001357B45A|nr:hypothetical protein [Arthrobacter sp. 18067]